MQKKTAWFVLSLFALAGCYLIYSAGWRKSLTGIVAFSAALCVVAVAALVWAGIGQGLMKLRRTLFPDPPLWERPRRASSLTDEKMVSELTQRLDQVEESGRIALWQDRHTGQRWKSIAYDFEFTQDIVYEPAAAGTHAADGR